MAIALPDGPPTRPRSRSRLWMYFSFMIFAVGLTSYCIVVLTYSGLGSLPDSVSPAKNSPSGHVHDSRPQNDPKPTEDVQPIDHDDPFTLHPEEHIHRQPHTIRLNWNVTKETRRPDGVLRDIYLINGRPSNDAKWSSGANDSQANSLALPLKQELAIHLKFPSPTASPMIPTTVLPSTGTVCL